MIFFRILALKLSNRFTGAFMGKPTARTKK